MLRLFILVSNVQQTRSKVGTLKDNCDDSHTVWFNEKLAFHKMHLRDNVGPNVLGSKFALGLTLLFEVCHHVP